MIQQNSAMDVDDDTDRSSESTQLEGNSTADNTIEDSAAVDDGTNDQRDFSPLQVSPMLIEEDLALVVSDEPVKYEMRRDELELLKNQLQGSHQEALASVIAQAHSKSRNKSPGVPSSSTGLSPMHVTLDSHLVKIPTDNYNWRKYGQKQVKSPEGSRSYYKCTYSKCDAKKIESCDQFSSVTKIVYRGHHKHDPPKRGKVLSTPESLKRKSISRTHGLKEHRPIQVEQMEHREKKSSSASHDSVLKHPKKHKFIVHAAADIEISADGYRWRKYGQKMVKGNPHPRNYYKCTCAGCPVRKHIEKVIDGSSEVIITYTGVHDHDMPVPKKRHGQPTGLLIAPASSPSKNISQSKKREHLSTRFSTSEAAKTSESARTLLSVGFEIKHC